MRRDAGSEQIRDLLDQDSERITRDLATLVGALRQAPDEEYGVPPQTAFDAIDDTRQAYEELRAQIDGIESSNPAKADVIAAIGVLDEGLDRFANGLETGVSKRGKRRLKTAKQVLTRGSTDLSNARARL
jgi:hypothetical protein